MKSVDDFVVKMKNIFTVITDHSAIVCNLFLCYIYNTEEIQYKSSSVLIFVYEPL
jgi:hypothetical protein